MSLTQSQIERLHDDGKMPDWIYYQVNGKTAEQNFQEQRKKIYDELNKRKEEEQIVNHLSDILYDLFDELFKNRNIDINL